MATKPRKRAPKAPPTPAPVHPAIVALIAVCDYFVRTARTVSRLFWSDFEHDKTAIARHPGAPFAWIACAYSTHMCFPLADHPSTPMTRVASSVRSWPRMVADATGTDDGPVMFCFWDGTGLQRYPTPEALGARIALCETEASIATCSATLADLAAQMLHSHASEMYYREQLDKRIAEAEQRLAGLRDLAEGARAEARSGEILPSCFAMGRLCAGHARGADPLAACDTRE